MMCQKSLWSLSVFIVAGLFLPPLLHAQDLHADADSLAEDTLPDTIDDTTENSADVAADDEEEEVVDFAAEEQLEEQQSQDLIGAVAGAAAAVHEQTALKLIVDLVADYRVGSTTWQFHPNHVLVLAEAQVMENLLFTVHISDDPLYFEAAWSPTPRLTLRAGRIFIPFGSNNFHHIIGGRVDEMSQFLPELWTDYGFAMNYQLYDGDYVSADYDLYMVNGFQGTDQPLLGASQASDNNLAKGYGGRMKLTLLSHYKITGSFYHDVWNAQESNNLLFYSVALELSPGFLPFDFANLKRLRLRGEWARGEIKLSQDNYQTGLLPHFAYARAGFYTEAQIPITHMVAARLRTGLINPNNTVKDAGDLMIVEPAIIIGFRSVSVILAYQAAIPVYGAYQPDSPGDLIYAKFFLML